MSPTQENKNADDITEMRRYFLERLDDLQKLVRNGVTREELANELDRVHQEIASNHAELSGQVVVVTGNVKEVLNQVKDMEKTFTEKQNAMERTLIDKQAASRNRIIAAQGAALLIILGTVVTLLGQILIHGGHP